MLKKIAQLVICFFHPLAVVLIWINLLGRSDMEDIERVAWAVFALIPLVPFLYVLTGHDFI